MDIVTPILNIVSVLCSCSANNRCCYLLDLQENKEDLNNALVELRATRDGVKMRVDEAENNPNHKCTPEVDNWLQRVQAIDDEVVQVIQNADQEIQGRCFGGNFPKNCRSAHKIGKLVIRKLATVKEHRSKGNFGDVANKLLPPSVQEEPTNTTVGMESMLDEVWRLLAEDEVRIMGLYGQGGVGKTTFLKQINNKFLKSTTTTTHGYDVVILVVVSKPLNIDAIQMEIGKRLGLSSPDKRTIFNTLTKKNFVLLLDDIWERVDLQSIGIPHHPENKKSKVIFTTRSKTVCGYMDANKIFRVDCLAWDKAWTLFQEKVGNETLNSETDPKVLDLAKVVAEKCCGLPLALITIGRAMSTRKSVREWNHAITTLRKSASDFPGMGDGVLPILKLSYDSLLDDTIKSCFLYCALFPEKFCIDRANLIDYWIGEGLILLNEFENIEEARDLGYNIIGILIDACLLESESGFLESLKMHDTIRDLALWIAHEYKSKRDKIMIIDTYDITTSERLWYNAERICVRIIYNEKTKVPVPLSTLNSPNLLTLIFESTYRTLLIIPQNFFSLMPLLRVLDLSYSNLETFPISITELLELRYLSLSRTAFKELPEEFGKLVKLNYLDLSFMRRLEKIPSGVIGSLLLELRVLRLCGCCPVWDFQELFKLKHLNHLGITISWQPDLEKLLSNKNLQMCTRDLVLSYREVVVKSQSTLEKLLHLLFNLETLMLLYFPGASMGIEQQQHLGRSCFLNLSKIQICRCNGLKDLTWVGYVPNLKRLYVYDCAELEEIIAIVVDDNSGGGSTGGGGGDAKDVFKRLRVFLMNNLPKLKSICRSALAFPCLEEMEVEKCPELKKLPFDSGSNVNNTLQLITGGPKWWSELQWEEEDNNNNNNDDELLKSKFLTYFVEDESFDDDEEDDEL